MQTAYLDTGANNVTFAHGISGAGGLTKLGVGALVLSANQSYTGATNVNAGTLVLNQQYTSVLSGSSPLIINNGGTVLANKDGTAIASPVTITPAAC